MQKRFNSRLIELQRLARFWMYYLMRLQSSMMLIEY
jgi:hypothetical protein